MEQSISTVYQKFIWTNEYSELAKKLYNNPPKTFSEVVDRIPKLVTSYEATGWYSDIHLIKLREGIRSANKSFSAMTREVSENIDRLENGGIEAAHQTVAIGGPCYILNKAATASILATLAQNSGHDITPFFFVADYDIVQPELTNIRTPIMGKDGNLISIPVPKGYEHSPVSTIPIPKYSDWYEQVEESIRDSYRPIFKVLKGHAKIIFEERMEQALSIIRWAYLKSVTLSEWAIHILGRVLNVEGKLGIPLIPASSPFLKEMQVRGMEYLLSKKNRETFLRVHDDSTTLIRSSGFVPGIGNRPSDYVPFYYECPEKECYRSRTELHYEEHASDVKLSGKCPTCGQKIEFETSSVAPDLQEISDYLSPRVDTRQMIIDMLFPVLAHVGGAGETAYYAQVIPIADELSIPFPSFVKYPRVYFNTPWNEQLATTLKEKKLPVLHYPEMFKIIGKINRFRKKNRPEDMNTALLEFETIIHSTHKEGNQALADILSRMETSEGKKDGDLAITRLELERYLSWSFGQYAEGKLGQEASWSWIEWVLNSGLHDHFGPYTRAYVPELKNGATMFVNFSA